MLKAIIINGPNLNLLGKREPDIYPRFSLDEINVKLKAFAEDNEVSLECFQTNHEGEIVDLLHKYDEEIDFYILNAAAYSHYSIAILDAVRAIDTPVIEVHLSNIAAREIYRQQSIISAACCGTITGFGVLSYHLALLAGKNLIEEEQLNGKN